mgnify:CR=1 FL=1
MEEGKCIINFCVIDNQIAIHGSYNWSTSAEMKNDEDITITYGDLGLATKHSIRFKQTGQLGDMIVSYHINIPTSLTEKQKDLFNQLRAAS